MIEIEIDGSDLERQEQSQPLPLAGEMPQAAAPIAQTTPAAPAADLPAPALFEDSRKKEQDAILVGRAVRNGWPVSDELKRYAVSELFKILQAPDGNKRNKMRAANILIAADKLNISLDELRKADIHKRLPSLHVHASLDLGVDGDAGSGNGIPGQVVEAGPGTRIAEAKNTVLQVIRNDPDYIEFLRQRALEEDCQPSSVCASDQPGEVEAGEAPVVSGQPDFEGAGDWECPYPGDDAAAAW